MTETDYQAAKALFKPCSPSANLRQRIWAHLGQFKQYTFTIPQLVGALGKSKEEKEKLRSLVYQSCKHLALKGLIRRTETLIDAPTKKDPGKQKAVISVQYVEPWTEKTEKKW